MAEISHKSHVDELVTFPLNYELLRVGGGHVHLSVLFRVLSALNIVKAQ